MTTVTGSTISGARLEGEEPHSLKLNDGSQLYLDAESDGGPVAWIRRTGADGAQRRLSTQEAADLAGEAFARYVRVRTRSEIEWLRNLAEWCDCEASRLSLELEPSR